MLEIKRLSYDELPDEIDKDGLPNNGSGKKYACYILVYHDGKLVCCESDAMEPEDATFYRDLGWIGGIIIQAYHLGKEDSR